jgi:hypothetical protein
MKSVTVKDPNGILILKVIHRKSGKIEVIYRGVLSGYCIDIRDDDNKKVYI